MKLNIPKYVKDVMDTLNKNGYEAYVVGGAVRDAMLGNCPEDWDVTTNAEVEEVKKCFKYHFDTGIKHGTVTVLSDSHPIEVTTYRIDGDYKDNRRPETVNFTKDLKEDLKRRDFTVNAMAYNPEDGLVDLYDGVGDLKNKIIRCVGDGEIRFTEDALRILRAIRFSAKLGFCIDENTLSAITSKKQLLKNISAERIQAELVKMLETDSNLDVLFKSGVGDVIFPEVDYKNVKLQNVPKDKELKLSALLYNTDIQCAKGFFNRLKFDNKTKENVLKVLECSRMEIAEEEYEIKKLLNKYGEILFEKSLVLVECYGKKTEYLTKIFNKVKTEPYAIKHLAVTGNDVIRMGVKGSMVGNILEKLLDEVMKNPKNNVKEKLCSMILEVK